MTADRKPINVQILRPYKGPLEWFFYVLFGIGFTFLTAYVLMLISGAVTTWGFGYWHTLLAIIGLRLVQVGSGWTHWTKAGSK